jgi:hypothetical protein
MDFMASRGPQALGICSTDTASCAAVINSASQRLMFARETGDSGWTGTWSEIAFNLSQADPHISTPRDVARIEALDMCTFPVPIQNEFYSYLRWGWGRFPKRNCTDITGATSSRRNCAPIVAYDRGRFPLFRDVVGTGQKIRVYLTDAADAGKRVLIGYRDSNGIPVRTLDGVVQVDGEFLTLVAPFVDTTFEVLPGPGGVTGLQKDVTLSRVTIYQVDSATADQVLLGFMEPGETTASYKRYFLGGVPRNCCNLPPGTGENPDSVQITALVQHCYIPVSVTTDYLCLPSLEALINECQCGRYLEMDLPNAKAMADYHHRTAIRLLQGQSIAEQGSLAPAVSFSPFRGSPFVTTGYG